jgi:hypothetical protein
MPANPTAVAILEFGKLLSQEERRHHKDRHPEKVQEAGKQLVERLDGERGSVRAGRPPAAVKNPEGIENRAFSGAL